MVRKKPGLMDRMTGSHPEQIEAAVAKAKEAWESNRLAYVHKVGSLASLDSEAATQIVDGILRIGWVLRSTALGYNTTGPNTEQVMFVFVRPD